jgi:hypothetical protein
MLTYAEGMLTYADVCKRGNGSALSSGAPELLISTPLVLTLRNSREAWGAGGGAQGGGGRGGGHALGVAEEGDIVLNSVMRIRRRYTLYMRYVPLY